MMMPSLTKETQMDRAKKTMREVVSYAEEVVRDERLRADLQAAIANGAKASDRVKRDIQAGGISTRLATDKKLRKNLRAMLDDLDHAGDRIRRKKSHRARNVLLVIAGGAATLVALPKARLWLAKRTSEIPDTRISEPDLVT
jgi:signal transduction protein with GAF and PtsI domain